MPYEIDGEYRECYISTSNIKVMYYDDCPELNPMYYQNDKLALIKKTDDFVSEIEQLRNLSNSPLSQYADGTIFRGNEALNLKLIDEIGGVNEAKEWLEKKLNIKLDIIYLELQ